MKRNKIFVLGLVAAFVAILSLTLVSGTWAKYTSTVTGSSSAQVAKWAFSYKSDKTAATQFEGVNFELFKTINDTKDGSVETDVLEGRIAPGTMGKFSFVLTNLGEVTANATVEFTLTNEENIPLKFYISDGTTETELEADDDGKYTITAGNLDYLGKTGGTNSRTLEVTWKWVFEDNTTATDNKDTALGSVGTATVTVNATIAFVQVD